MRVHTGICLQCCSDQIKFLQKSKTETKDALYMNDHQKKDVSIEIYCSNHNKGMETGINKSSFSK